MSVSADQNLRDKFLGGMSHAACTVNIITTDGNAGRAGVTVSAMSSVSADTPKPTLLVCVHHMSPAAQKIIDNGCFVVNVLRDDQAYISDTFAGRFRDTVEDKFDCAEWAAMPSGAPRVVDPLVAFDCKVMSSDRIGTHYVFFGEVQDIFNAGQGSPLIYANRAYGSASRIESATSIAAGQQRSRNALTIGCFHTFEPYVLPSLISQMNEQDPAICIKLIEGDQRRVQESLLAGESELALLYDLDLHEDLTAVPLTHLTPYVLLAEGHPLAANSKLSPQDLAETPMVLLDIPPSREYFVGIFKDVGIEPVIAHRSASFEMVRGMVGHGLGFSLLATKPAASITYDGLGVVTRPLTSAPKPGQIVLARRKNANLSKPAEQFMWFCHEFFDIGE